MNDFWAKFKPNQVDHLESVALVYKYGWVLQIRRVEAYSSISPVEVAPTFTSHERPITRERAHQIRRRMIRLMGRVRHHRMVNPEWGTMMSWDVEEFFLDADKGPLFDYQAKES